MTDMITRRKEIPLGEAAGDLNDLGSQLLQELDELCSAAVFHARHHSELAPSLELFESARDVIADALDEVLTIKRHEDRAGRLHIVKAEEL